MRIIAAAFIALAGLFFLTIAVVGVVRGGEGWPALLGSILSSALMALVGIISLRVAGYLLQQRGESVAVLGATSDES